MSPTSGKQTQETAEQRVEEEALRVAKSIQTPGQTKEQTRLIAKGIEKGIALYKQQQSAKLRERDKQRKKAAKLKARESAEAHEPEAAAEFRDDYPALRPTLWLMAVLFGFGGGAHLLRWFWSAPLTVGDLVIAPVWSVPAATGGFALSAWLVWLARRLD
ncbi:MAG: DUF2956 domain-containing protein [Methylococcaceae bacterium]|nr:DUF2956 domain-containing protein [Methylococcaceae bacterium]